MTHSGGVSRLFTGVRPHGPLHLGQYVSVIRQCLARQDEQECFFLIADVQALATHAKKPEALAAAVRDVVTDCLAAGLDPQRVHFFVQSRTRELAELTIYLQMLVRTGELRHNVAMREEARALGQRHLYEKVNEIDFALLGYPVAQVADMLLFTTTPPGPDDRLLVPVGRDQLPHVELARKVARRFNGTYGPVFLEPEARAADELPGTDGGYRMGTSARHSILLSETREEYEKKIRDMFTDPSRLRREDPGHPDECACYAFLKALGGDASDLDQRRAGCRGGETDCEECKSELVNQVSRVMGPIQERRAQVVSSGLVDEALRAGTRRAQEVATATMERVKEAMHLSYGELDG